MFCHVNQLGPLDYCKMVILQHPHTKPPAELLGNDRAVTGVKTKDSQSSLLTLGLEAEVNYKKTDSKMREK